MVRLIIGNIFTNDPNAKAEIIMGNFFGPGAGPFDANAKAELEKALSAVDRALAKLQEPTSFDKGELRGVVAQSRAELAKPSPNKTLLGPMLAVVATGIQTVGSMKDAYATLKSALGMIGINIP
jgi:hypothetical protein